MVFDSIEHPFGQLDLNIEHAAVAGEAEAVEHDVARREAARRHHLARLMAKQMIDERGDVGVQVVQSLSVFVGSTSRSSIVPP